MGWELTRRVYLLGDTIPTVPKQVLLRIAHSASDQGDRNFGGAFASVETMALECGLHRVTVFKALAWLQDDAHPFIAREEVGGGRGHTSSYRVLVDKLPPSGTGPALKRVVVSNGSPRLQKRLPRTTQTVADGNQNSSRGQQKRLPSTTQRDSIETLSNSGETREIARASDLDEVLHVRGLSRKALSPLSDGFLGRVLLVAAGENPDVAARWFGEMRGAGA